MVIKKSGASDKEYGLNIPFVYNTLFGTKQKIAGLLELPTQNLSPTKDKVYYPSHNKIPEMEIISWLEDVQRLSYKLSVQSVLARQLPVVNR